MPPPLTPPTLRLLSRNVGTLRARVLSRASRSNADERRGLDSSWGELGACYRSQAVASVTPANLLTLRIISGCDFARMRPDSMKFNK